MSSIFKYDKNVRQQQLKYKIDEEFSSENIRQILDNIPKDINWEEIVAELDSNRMEMRHDFFNWMPTVNNYLKS